MKLKLDANLGTRGLALLPRAGHDVCTADAQGMARASDADLLRACTAEKRALLTLDTDFANPLQYPPVDHAGVVVLRTAPRTTLEDLEEALRAFIAAVGDGPLMNRLLIVDPHRRVREYRPWES